MEGSLQLFPGPVALNRNLSPSTMQSLNCSSCGRVYSQRSGLTRHRHSTHAHLHPNSRNHSTSDGLDYKLADDIPQFDDHTQNQQPEMEIFLNAGAPIDDTACVQSYEDDDWDLFSPFATSQQWQLCCSIVATNQGTTKLNNILKRRLIVADANAKKPDHLYQLITDMEEMDGMGCGWEQSSINIEGKATLVWYRNPIPVVRHFLGHPSFNDRLRYMPVKQLDSNGECIYAELWTADWWCKTQASFLVLSERECQREHVRETVSEGTCQRASESDCQREHVREHVTECVRERHSQIVRDCVSEIHSGRAGSMSRVSAPVLTGFL